MSDERNDKPPADGSAGASGLDDKDVPKDKSKVKVTMQLNTPLVFKDAPVPGRASTPGDGVVVIDKRTPVPRASELPIATEASTGEVRVRYYGTTDVGLVREHNEDNFIVADLAASVRGLDGDKPRETTTKGLGVLLAVCDGMGGAAAGEVASQMAVDTLYEVLSNREPTLDRDVFARRLVNAVEEAGSRIFGAAKMDRTRRGMGTTSTVAGLMDKVLFIGQVGDSRAYLRRGNKVTLITKDQSLVNQLIEAGQLTEEEAEAFEHSNIILQALGTTEEVQVDLTFIELRQGDRLMLCSDGLSGLVHPEHIADVMREEEDLVACSKKLITMANSGGGHDNITVICADFHGEGLAPADAETPAMYQQYPLPPDEAKDPEGARAAKQGVGSTKILGADDDPPELPLESSQGQGPRRPATPQRRMFSVALITLGVGIGIGLGLFLAFASDLYTIARTSTRKILHARAEQVEVTVVTDAEGELFIDDDRYGGLHDGKPVTVKLMTGGHRFEARSGGSSVASADVSVEKGQPTIIELRLPRVMRASDADGGVATPEDTKAQDRAAKDRAAADKAAEEKAADDKAAKEKAAKDEKNVAPAPTPSSDRVVAPAAPTSPSPTKPTTAGTTPAVTPATKPAPKAPTTPPAP